jgi:uncharacterized protein (TIGR04255 family)
MRDDGTIRRALVRVASSEFVQGPTQPISALVDIDVFTPDGYISDSPDTALQWIEDAHTMIKREFFALLPDDVLTRLERK